MERRPVSSAGTANSVDRLRALLKQSFHDVEIEQLGRIGAQLSEVQVVNLALGD
jgi:hypothetical protein